MLPNAKILFGACAHLEGTNILGELIFYYTYLFSVLLVALQTCQLSRFPRETPALEALVYFPHDF